ncbi:MAG: Maf family protein [Wenzhouxiangellaceae bacterium]|nr:Maf family protein [Wenzhouxiangellaceae bacterium]
MIDPGARRLILASASPRRRELLATLVEDFDVVPADIDESVRGGEAPADYVPRMAREKAAAVRDRFDGCSVIGSDTAVVVDGRSLGKPGDDSEARAMLSMLSGRCHEVLSSVCLCTADGRRLERLSCTVVEFAPLPEDWIAAYVATGDPMDKAGAYAIQGAPAAWIRRIDGSWSGVVGLPLFETASLLREAGRASAP